MDNINTTNKNHEYADLVKKTESLLLLLNKYIEVRLVKNCSFQGFVQAIDPITYSIILSIPCEDSFRSGLIFGHAIISVLELTPPPHIKQPKVKQNLSTNVDIKEKKAQVMAWLKENLLPVSESEDKILLGNASLLPPYTITDICTNNPMVAMQMRKIIEIMPQDFNPNKTES